MGKIYMNANDKNVATTIVYYDVDSLQSNGSDGSMWAYGYKDPKFTIKFTAAELLDAFNKGAIIHDPKYDAYRTPIEAEGFGYANDANFVYMSAIFNPSSGTTLAIRPLEYTAG